jgi:endonuclease YncB( thermonuclease family)
MKALDRVLLLGLALLAGSAAPVAALADCAPPMPGAGRVEGVVRGAEDGATICIQTGADALHLIRLRLIDVAAPPLTSPGGEGAKWALRRAARGRTVVCQVLQDGVGLCRAGAVTVGELVKAQRR